MNAVSVHTPETEPMWLYRRSISAMRALMILALRGTGSPCSMSSEYAMQLATHVSPDMRSTRRDMSLSAGTSMSFSIPLWVYPNEGFSCITGSPATLNLKWPGSIIPACTGPTGISNTSSPEIVLEFRGIRISVDLSYGPFCSGWPSPLR